MSGLNYFSSFTCWRNDEDHVVVFIFERQADYFSSGRRFEVTPGHSLAVKVLDVDLALRVVLDPKECSRQEHRVELGLPAGVEV